MGDYAAIRDFNGRSGLEYATGNMQMTIDFDDFNSGNGVQGTVSNRAIYDVNGVDITAGVLAALSTEAGAPETVLPSIIFSVGPGVADSAGEISGTVGTTYQDSAGAAIALDSGRSYAVLSGPQGREVTGIVVMSGPDVRSTAGTVTVRETGRFILVN